MQPRQIQLRQIQLPRMQLRNRTVILCQPSQQTKPSFNQIHKTRQLSSLLSKPSKPLKPL